ncbi:hypothetical protein SAMN05216559_3718 [Halomicrobium zhouii]|uniref:Uncharacterized protein n=1 Tax=Halomicrobium zhouii TaxID=767519 RepID=A0A1I6M3Y8_9EURY|nr:hypothetical protein [Halomicrobium zhouii]SFS10384.1 hypothetical protein SAMN05216559_3718 [Halomicrobium zhouii]
MAGPRVPRNDPWVRAALERILDDVTVPQGDLHEICRFMNHELPGFEQAAVSYLVLGSYRGSYHVRLRTFTHRLELPTTTTATILGDTIDLETNVLPAFDIKIHLLGEAADYIAGVYEKEDGGEAPEFGVVRSLFAPKSHVLPRDYAGLSPDELDTPETVRRAAVEIFFADVDDDARRDELLRLLSVARDNGVDITERELVDFLEQRRQGMDEPPASYSWSHLSFFRRFDAMGQCYPWDSEAELYAHVDELPGPGRPEWEHEYDPADLPE